MNAITGYGILVHPTPCWHNNHLFYAEVEPSYSRWLPWPGRTSRWWYEVHATHDPIDDLGTTCTTYAYVGGSGGAFTFRGCVRKAQKAVEHFAEAAYILPFNAVLRDKIDSTEPQ